MTPADEVKFSQLEARVAELEKNKVEFPLDYTIQGIMGNTNFPAMTINKIKGGFPVFSETPAYSAKQGEVVLVDDEVSLRRICTFLGGAWYCQNISRSIVRAYLSSDKTIGAGATEKLAFDAESYDLLSEFDITTNYRFTPKNTGYYLISLKLYSDADSNSYLARIYKNGSNYSAFRVLTRGYSEQVVDSVYLVGNTDYIEIFIENLAVSGKVFDSGTDGTTLNILRMD